MNGNIIGLKFTKFDSFVWITLKFQQSVIEFYMIMLGYGCEFLGDSLEIYFDTVTSFTVTVRNKNRNRMGWQS